MSDMSPDDDDAAISDSSGASVTDEQHDWASGFIGMDTRAGSDDGAGAAASAPADDNSSSGGFFSGVANAVSSAASGLVSAASTVETKLETRRALVR